MRGEMVGHHARPVCYENLFLNRERIHGTAMMGGFPAAILDLADVDSMSGEELCKTAEDNGIDLRKFVIE